ncbi:MFS transporter, partial [Proteus mirabilis]|nr:MFS transporter [Proteus mirabilis]
MRVDKVDKRVLGPVLMGFFIMGFCDIVAPISGRIATEFPASQQAAVSFLPTMVFLWFLVLSTPLAALMNRIGRKAMSMIGYAFTIAGLL